jgi:hypothetical protein
VLYCPFSEATARKCGRHRYTSEQEADCALRTPRPPAGADLAARGLFLETFGLASLSELYEVFASVYSEQNLPPGESPQGSTVQQPGTRFVAVGGDVN